MSSMPDALMNWMGNIQRFIKLSSFDVTVYFCVAIELCILVEECNGQMAVSSMLEVWVFNVLWHVL